MLSTREILLGNVNPDLDEDDLDNSIVISPDRSRAAYVIKHKEGYIVVIDGVEGKEYEEVSVPVFSPDSKHMAYGAMRGGKCIVVLDGVEGKECDGIYGDAFIFSPDSKRLTYGARYGQKMFLVVNEEEEK